MVNIYVIQEHVLKILNAGLASSITYHKAEHAADVAKQAIAIGQEEGITDEQTLLELQIAGLYHDTGFLFTYKGHEEKSCEIAKRELPDFGVDENSIENICEIIMATKIPQRPKKPFATNNM